jgi:hypothetical protein
VGLIPRRDGVKAPPDDTPESAMPIRPGCGDSPQGPGATTLASSTHKMSAILLVQLPAQA